MERLNSRVEELYKLTNQRVSVLEFLGKYSLYIKKELVAEFDSIDTCCVYLDFLIKYEQVKRVKK